MSLFWGVKLVCTISTKSVSADGMAVVHGIKIALSPHRMFFCHEKKRDSRPIQGDPLMTPLNYYKKAEFKSWTLGTSQSNTERREVSVNSFECGIDKYHFFFFFQAAKNRIRESDAMTNAKLLFMRSGGVRNGTLFHKTHLKPVLILEKPPFRFRMPINHRHSKHSLYI